MSNNKQSGVFVKTMIFVVLAIILTVGVTYAYFRANITGVESESTISVGGATLAIKYEGSNLITAQNVIPGWIDKKYFNVDLTNTSRKDISYDINLVVEKNNFFNPDTYDWSQPLDPSYLRFTLFECDSAEDKVCDTYLSDALIYTQSGDQFVYRVTTNTSGKRYYALEIVFPNPTVEQSQTGTDGNPLYFSGYITIDSTKEVYVEPFTTDSWATIASNIQSGNASRYKVGEEKEVEMDIDDDGIIESYTVRVANNSTPSECSTEGFSQTACGFVVEFVDIVEQRAMNSSATNVGGWPATEMRTYLNGEFLAKLPSDLQNVIADTTVISGHGSTSGETNFTSTDKIYLLSTREVWVDGSSNTVSSKDTAYSTTRQLDYYDNKGVTTNNFREAIKKYNGTADYWWLRSAKNSSFKESFLCVDSDGDFDYDNANERGIGLAPAFRIG